MDVRARVTTLTDVYAMKFEAQPMSLGGETEPSASMARIVSAQLFLGARHAPAAGRLLIDDDDRGARPGTR